VYTLSLIGYSNYCPTPIKKVCTHSIKVQTDSHASKKEHSVLPVRTWARQSGGWPRRATCATSPGHSWPRRGRRRARRAGRRRHSRACACGRPSWRWGRRARRCARRPRAAPARRLCAHARCAPAPTCNFKVRKNQKKKSV